MQIYIPKKDGHSCLEWQSRVGAYVYKAMQGITQILLILICQWEILIQKLQKKFNIELSR
jgi:hypothetical protein